MMFRLLGVKVLGIRVRVWVGIRVWASCLGARV